MRSTAVTKFCQIVLLIAIVEAMTGCSTQSDPSPPETVANPQHVIRLVVSGADSAGMRFTAGYISDVRTCPKHIVGVGDFPRGVSVPVQMTRVGVDYVGYIDVDRFEPGICGWHFSLIHYGVANEPVISELAISTDPIAQLGATVLQREFWCYRVSYQGKLVHTCEDIASLKWSNAIRAVSREFLSRFTLSQLGAGYVPRVSDQTEEIHVLLHDLNAIPNALIPVLGDRRAEIARAEVDKAAFSETPQYKALMCAQDVNFQYVRTHHPLPDTATQRAVLTAIKDQCDARFGLPPGF